jgi:predicted DNA binding CopG/RHH family protein
MEKKDKGTNWAKGGIITLTKPQHTDNTDNTEITSNKDIAHNTEIKSIAVKDRHRLTLDISEKDFIKLRIIAAQHGRSIVAYIRDIVINGEGE